MDLKQLHCSWQNYYCLGASPSTWKVYNAGLSRYQTFCKMANRSMFPASEDTSCCSPCTWLQKAYWAPLSKYTSLLYVRTSHVAAGRYKEFSKQLTPRLQQVIKWIQKQQAITSPQRICRPISIEILKGLHSILSKHPQ